jgi:cation diffusion facilitator family transporter
MQHEKERVALTSILASAALTLAKAIVGFATGSLALLSEAAHSLIDFAATLMTYVAVRLSGKPADEQHHYGHGKIESVTALAETGLLFLLSFVVAWEAGKRLIGDESHEVEATLAAFIVIGLSIVVDFFRARALRRTAHKTSSQALAADALHFSSDLWSSLAVLIGLIGIHYGLPWADSTAAVVVAFLVGVAGWRLGRRTIDTLTDAAPPGVAAKVLGATRRVAGVVAVNQVRAREVGEKIFIDLTVDISRTLPLDRVDALKQAVIADIGKAIPGAEVQVGTQAVALDNETVLDRVMVIARNRALAVHHVTVQEIQDRLSVSLDLEVDGKLTLEAAHEIADRLEDDIAAELGAAVEVETHIEPLEPVSTLGREAPPERVRAVEVALGEIAAETRVIRDVHDVRVRETEQGEIVNFHCRIDPAMTVLDVHEKVDEVERALKMRSPQVARVIGHAEPLH